MGSTSLISKILDEPHRLTDAEKKSIDELIKAYPYFVPLQYVKEFLRGAEAPPSNIKDLYVANWLLFRELMQKGQPVAEVLTVTPVVEPEAPVVEETPEPVATPVAEEAKPEEKEPVADSPAEKEEPLIAPVYTEDYFRHQGVQISDEIPAELDHAGKEGGEKNTPDEQDPKSLMVMMSFSEWLLYFKTKKQKETEEEEERKALKTMWQKEKLAAAMEEEGEEIPEEVFKMAVDSISKEEGLVSESLAEIHYKQGRHDKAVDMYRKLSLRNPQKKAYFARKIDEILKNKH